MNLILPVKRKWFEQIKSGIKTEEYRLFNDYWHKRLFGKKFDKVIITLGYPTKDDNDRRLVFQYSGYTIKTIIHSEWENVPHTVFAIRLQP